MKRKALFIAASMICLAGSGDDPDPADWYTPEGGWSGGNAGEATVYTEVGGESGDVKFQVDENGKSTEFQAIIDQTKNITVKLAYQAIYEALQAQVMVRNMAKSLDTLLFTKGIQITPQGGQAYTIRFGNSIKEALGNASDGTMDATSTVDEGLDEKSLHWRQSGGKRILEVFGWNSPTLVGGNLAERLVEGENIYKIPVRMHDNSPVRYISIGKLTGVGGGGAPPDEHSITTNDTEYAGKLSIVGFRQAYPYRIPYKPDDSDDLKWVRARTLWSGDTVKWVDDKIANKEKAELTGWVEGMGNLHYFGTPASGSEPGFYELPNTTTNYVTGDEVHITSNIQGAGTGSEVKTFKFKLPTGEGPFVVTSAGFAPLSAEEMGEIKVDNSSIFTNTSAQLELKGWSEMQNGFLGKTVGGELVTKQVIPTNGLVKVAETDGRFEFGLDGWDRGECNASLSAMLTDENDLDRVKHLLLARFADGNTEEIHYVPIGDVIKTNAPPKEISINGVTGTNFVFETASDSDVRFAVEQGADGAIHIKVGVYYK